MNSSSNQLKTQNMHNTINITQSSIKTIKFATHKNLIAPKRLKHISFSISRISLFSRFHFFPSRLGSTGPVRAGLRGSPLLGHEPKIIQGRSIMLDASGNQKRPLHNWPSCPRRRGHGGPFQRCAKVAQRCYCAFRLFRCGREMCVFVVSTGLSRVPSSGVM